MVASSANPSIDGTSTSKLRLPVAALMSNVRPHMDIRGALPSEHEALSRLALASKGHWGYSSDQLHLWRNELVFTADAIAARPTFVAEEPAGVPIGVVQINPTVEPWEVEALWVLPSAVGRGVGRALLRQALQVAREAGRKEVAVDADPNAEGFYLSFGARRIGEREAPIDGQPRRVRPQLLLATRDA
jgi:GNAT superfamily N-acetyltransferase